MTSTSARPSGSSNLSPVHRPQAATGRFILTLCPLAAPVSIRPPQSPQLKPFTFFMSRVRDPDGGERLYLNMGYFESLADAERWAESVRRHYPSAFATLAPVALLRPANSEAPALPRAARDPLAAQEARQAAVQDESLSDTQVLKILETRRISMSQGAVDEGNFDQIALLRPEDTSVRRALKEAVVQGQPVSFAVQLHWSTQPIDLNRVPPLAVFRAHTLYATESHRKGRCCYFLRLGFFSDPIAAKQVAVQVLSTFAAAAVVPILELEVGRAREAARSGSQIPYLAEQRDAGASNPDGTLESSAQSTSLNTAARSVSQLAGNAEQTLEPGVEGDMWADSDSLSESGVRHLRVEMQEHASGRWRVVRLRATQPNMMHIHS
jgi:hypothetical protein